MRIGFPARSYRCFAMIGGRKSRTQENRATKQLHVVPAENGVVAEKSMAGIFAQQRRKCAGYAKALTDLSNPAG
jgi:hypothetical protein